MKQLTHDNENDTWGTLGLAAARVLANISKQKNDGQEESSSGADDKQRALDQAEFLQRGIDGIRKFEERAAGVDRPRGKRRI